MSCNRNVTFYNILVIFTIWHAEVTDAAERIDIIMSFTKRKEEIESMMEGQRIRNHLLLGGLALCTALAAFGICSKISSNRRHKKVEPEPVEIVTVEMTPLSSMAELEEKPVYEELAEVSTEAVQVDLVATHETSEFDGRFIANITDTLNVRAEANADSELVGKMYPGCAGDILGTEGEWTKIVSGDVEGYVKTEYILTGKDAEPMAEEYGKYVATVTADLVRVRRDTDTESEAIAMLEQDDEVFVTDTLDGWYQVLVNETWEGYVSADYVDVEYKLDTAITIEEELARIRAAKEAEAAKLAASAQSTASSSATSPVTVATQVQAPTAASYDDAYLLACLISMEAGYEPYEGQLAVANVVLNRLHSGAFEGSISSVIYAPGQFPSVNGSVMNGYLQNGPLPQAQQAANEALSGVNNIGGYMYFINVRYANYASYGDYSIIGNHCFH